MTQSRKAAKSILMMILFGLGGKLLGFIREMLIASRFGSGLETDTFFMALAAVTLFTGLLTQTLNTTMIPVLSEIGEEKGQEGKGAYTNNLLNIIILISMAVVALAWFASPLIIRILAPGFRAGQFDLAVILMRIGMPAMLFAGTVGVYRGYLQSELNFFESAAASFPFNFVYITFLLFLSAIYGIKGLMAAGVLAVGAQLLIQFPGLKKSGYRYRFLIDFQDPGIRKIFYLILPVLVNISLGDLNAIIDKAMASTLIEGSISALNYAFRLNAVVLAIFITAITTVFFPLLSKEAARENLASFKKLVAESFNVILLITVPAAVGLIVLARPLVRLAFERGAFDPSATAMTAGALIFYSLGLVGMALRILMTNVFYSLQDTKTPMYNGLLALGLNVVLNFILIGPLAHGGLALATAIATTLTTLTLIWALRKKIGKLGLIGFARCALKSLLSALIMGALLYLLYYQLGERLAQTALEPTLLLGAISLGAIVYFLFLYLLRVEEIARFVGMLKGRLGF